MSTTGSQAAAGSAFAGDLELVTPPNATPIGDGVKWISVGFSLFTRAWLMWIVSLLVVFVLAAILSFIPILGQIAVQVLTPVIIGGWMVACRSIEKGGEFEIEHLFAGFKNNFVPLMIVGVLYLVGWIAILLIAALVAGFGMLGAFLTGNPNQIVEVMSASGMSMLLAGLIVLALMVPLLMFYWFGPALVILHNLPPVQAMTTSFSGCLRNILPFTLYGIVMFVLCIIAAIPFGLGLLVLVPVGITSSYAAYREIFTESAQV
jgi:uncharacterized membrane protein